MELSGIETCYVGALAEGLRLINEKALERRIENVELDPEALIRFVRVKGDRLLSLALQEDPDFVEKSKPRAESFETPPPKRKLARCKEKATERCGCGESATHKGWCVFRITFLFDPIVSEEKACVCPA